MPPAPIRAALAGLAHGVLEWLPVSSSGHVALLVDGAGWPEAASEQTRALRTLEVALHTGSMLPLGLAVRDDLADQPDDDAQLRLLAAGLGATVITSAVGATLGPAVEARFGGPRAVAAGLIAGSLALVAAERATQPPSSPPTREAALSGTRPGAPSRTVADLAAKDVIVLGLAQSAAIWPGVSRRAATLAAGRALRFDAEAASALSWAAGLPTLAGATSWQGYRDRAALRSAAPNVLAGVIASAGAGLVTRRLPERTRRWPAATWAAWRMLLAAATLLRR